MPAHRWIGLLLFTLAPAACGSSPGSPSSTAANAAMGTGLVVVAAGINRAVTHECWAACRPGLVCDSASGLCVEQGLAKKPAPSRTAEAEPVATNRPGHEYEVPPLDAPGGDAGPRAVEVGDAQAP